MPGHPYGNPPVIDLTELCNTADDATANAVIELAVDGGWILESSRTQVTRSGTRTTHRASYRSTRQSSRGRGLARPPSVNARQPAANARAPADNGVACCLQVVATAANSSPPPPATNTPESVINPSSDVINLVSPEITPEGTEHVTDLEPTERIQYPNPQIINPEPIVIADSPQVPTAQRKVGRISRKTSREVQHAEYEEPIRERSPLGGRFGVCPICLDHLGSQQLVSTKCGHVFCKNCLILAMRREKRCPTCRKPLRGTTAFHPLFLL